MTDQTPNVEKPKVIEGGAGLRTGSSIIPANVHGICEGVPWEEKPFLYKGRREKSFGESLQGGSLFSVVLVSSSWSNVGLGSFKSRGGREVRVQRF